MPVRFTLLQIMQKAEAAYGLFGLGLPYHHRTGRPARSPGGDSLAVFIVREMADLAGRRGISLDNLWEIIHGLETARGDLERVIAALTELADSATEPDAELKKAGSTTTSPLCLGSEPAVTLLVRVTFALSLEEAEAYFNAFEHAPGLDVLAAARAAVAEFLATADGQADVTGADGHFNWGDAMANVPDEVWERHGLRLLTHPSENCPALYVEQNESLLGLRL